MTSKGKGNIKYSVKKSRRAKRMRVAVYCDGSVVVTTPFGVGESIAGKFIEEKKLWILKKLDYFKQNDSTFMRKYSKVDYQKHKDEAMDLVVARVEYFNKEGGFVYNKIFVKNQKTRWGSCSRKGNLNFNYKIVFLPKQLSDYIIVHEMCHLKEFSHSKKFWNLIENMLQDYKETRNELRNHELYYR